jgi:hypothetical protein
MCNLLKDVSRGYHKRGVCLHSPVDQRMHLRPRPAHESAPKICLPAAANLFYLASAPFQLLQRCRRRALILVRRMVVQMSQIEIETTSLPPTNAYQIHGN